MTNPAAQQCSGSLVVDVDAGERIDVMIPAGVNSAARRLSLKLLVKSGRRARLQILADEDVTIDRREKATDPG